MIQVFPLVLFFLNNTLLDNDLLKIKEQCLEYPTTNIFDHLNINSVSNIFDGLIEIMRKNLNIFITLESKLDATFQKINSK